MKHYSGSCLCKEVTYEVTGSFNVFYLCHCSRCRKVTGSAHAANLFSKEGELIWKSGKDFVKKYQLPDVRFVKSFCSCCGCALPTVLKNGAVMVPAGSLDTKVDVSPNGHIFFSSRANWDNDLEKVQKFENLPN